MSSAVTIQGKDSNNKPKYIKADANGNLQTSSVSSTGVAQGIDDDGGAYVNGLAYNAVRVSAGVTYNVNNIKGFRLLLKGTGSLTFTPDTVGATAVTITAAEITEMAATAYNDWPVACSELTAGTGMEVLVYI